MIRYLILGKIQQSEEPLEPRIPMSCLSREGGAKTKAHVLNSGLPEILAKRRDQPARVK